MSSLKCHRLSPSVNLSQNLSIYAWFTTCKLRRTAKVRDPKAVLFSGALSIHLSFIGFYLSVRKTEQKITRKQTR